MVSSHVLSDLKLDQEDADTDVDASWRRSAADLPESPKQTPEPELQSSHVRTSFRDIKNQDQVVRGESEGMGGDGGEEGHGEKGRGHGGSIGRKIGANISPSRSMEDTQGWVQGRQSVGASTSTRDTNGKSEHENGSENENENEKQQHQEQEQEESDDDPGDWVAFSEGAGEEEQEQKQEQEQGNITDSLEHEQYLASKTSYTRESSLGFAQSQPSSELRKSNSQSTRISEPIGSTIITAAPPPDSGSDPKNDELTSSSQQPATFDSTTGPSNIAEARQSELDLTLDKDHSRKSISTIFLEDRRDISSSGHLNFQMHTNLQSRGLKPPIQSLRRSSMPVNNLSSRRNINHHEPSMSPDMCQSPAGFSTSRLGNSEGEQDFSSDSLHLRERRLSMPASESHSMGGGGVLHTAQQLNDSMVGAMGATGLGAGTLDSPSSRKILDQVNRRIMVQRVLSTRNLAAGGETGAAGPQAAAAAVGGSATATGTATNRKTPTRAAAKKFLEKRMVQMQMDPGKSADLTDEQKQAFMQRIATKRQSRSGLPDSAFVPSISAFEKKMEAREKQDDDFGDDLSEVDSEEEDLSLNAEQMRILKEQIISRGTSNATTPMSMRSSLTGTSKVITLPNQTEQTISLAPRLDKKSSLEPQIDKMVFSKDQPQVPKLNLLAEENPDELIRRLKEENLKLKAELAAANTELAVFRAKQQISKKRWTWKSSSSASKSLPSKEIMAQEIQHLKQLSAHLYDELSKYEQKAKEASQSSR